MAGISYARSESGGEQLRLVARPVGMSPIGDERREERGKVMSGGKVKGEKGKGRRKVKGER